MPKKVALTVSGAVSLGSYEAGVLYEVIHAIGQHNRHPATAPADQIHIDVLTGASAGGMTAAIAAQKLLYDANALADPYDNAFYRPWVAEIGIERLLEFHGDDNAQMSIFSSQTVSDISQSMLTARYATTPPPPPVAHPAVDANHLSLGLALSNLNGVDYQLATRPAGSIVYTRYQDELIRRFPAPQRPAADNGATWETVRKAVLSCGAFPLAFRVVELVRQGREYALPNLLHPVPPTQTFAYTDGGVFQNEPLSLAKRLVDEIDGHLNPEARFFLFIAPELKGSAADAEFNQNNAQFVPTTKRLASAIFNQARFPDLLLAEEKNRQVRLLDERAHHLGSQLHHGTPAADTLATSLAAAATPLLDALFAGQPEAIAAGRHRLHQQYAGDFPNLSPAARAAWIDTILTLETSAGLAATDAMTIYSITASDTELAGTALEAFAGFFDRRYREHDYDVGRQKARNFLATPGIFGLAGKLNYTPGEIRPRDPALSGLTLSRMDRTTREQVRDRLLDRVNTALIQAGVHGFIWGPAARKAVLLGFVKPALNTLLEL